MNVIFATVLFILAILYAISSQAAYKAGTWEELEVQSNHFLASFYLFVGGFVALIAL